MRFIQEIEMFVTVAEAGSFTSAAARLETAKSSVSDGVRTLEDRLGVRLLDRTTRNVRLSEPGKTFFTRCRQLLDDLDFAQDEVRALQAAPAGHLRIAVPETFLLAFVVPCLDRLLKDHPALRVELVSGNRAAKLVEEDFDLAIRVTEKIAPPLIGRRLGIQRMIVVASPGYLREFGVPQYPSDIRHHRVIGTAWPLPGHDGWLFDGEKVPISPQVTMSSAQALRVAALAGLGLAAVPDWAVGDALAAGSLTQVLSDRVAPLWGIFAVHSPGRCLSPSAEALVENLEREMGARGVPLH